MDATHLILEVVLKLKMLLIITASSAFLEPWIATGVGTECGQAIVVCSAVVSQGGKIRGFQDLAICCPCYVSSSINTGLTLKPKLCDHPYLLVPFFRASARSRHRREVCGGRSLHEGKADAAGEASAGDLPPTRIAAASVKNLL